MSPLSHGSDFVHMAAEKTDKNVCSYGAQSGRQTVTKVNRQNIQCVRCGKWYGDKGKWYGKKGCGVGNIWGAEGGLHGWIGLLGKASLKDERSKGRKGVSHVDI